MRADRKKDRDMTNLIVVLATLRKRLNLYVCPHSVFMCFVWISEQTAIISLYSIN